MTDTPYPDQDTSVLEELLATRQYRQISRLSYIANLHAHHHSMTRLLETYEKLEKELSYWNKDLLIDGPEHSLATFAFLCSRILSEAWLSRSQADTLDRIIERGVVKRLLDMPALGRLHERQTYVDLLVNTLYDYLRWLQDQLGELAYASQYDFVAKIHRALTRRREAWKASLKARLPIDRETLVSLVWSPRNMWRWLTAAGENEAALSLLFNGFEHESVGCR